MFWVAADAGEVTYRMEGVTSYFEKLCIASLDVAIHYN